MWRVRAFSIAAVLVWATAFEARATVGQVEATLHLKVGNGTSAVSVLSLDPFTLGPFEGTGVAPIVVSGGPGTHFVSFPGGIPIATSGTYSPEPHALVPQINPFAARVQAPDIGPGALTLPAGGGFGELPIRGEIFWGVLSGPVIQGPLTLNSGMTGWGVGGPLFAHVSPSVRISIQGAPWTVGAVSLQSQTTNGAVLTFVRSGFAHGPLSGTTSVVQADGVLQLITPLQVQSTTAFHPTITWGMFGELTLRFVPEPSMNVMLLLGSALLAALGARRRR